MIKKCGDGMKEQSPENVDYLIIAVDEFHPPCAEVRLSFGRDLAAMMRARRRQSGTF